MCKYWAKHFYVNEGFELFVIQKYFWAPSGSESFNPEHYGLPALLVPPF